jgi:hypothetical protein
VADGQIGGMTPEQEDFEFDVALSFAGEDRATVESIAEDLKERGLRPFYDNDHEVSMWGEDLYVYLDKVYRMRAKYSVVFVSRHYIRKAWTNHERQSVQARALTSESAYLLPVKLDDAELPGLRPTIAYLDARHRSTGDIAAAIDQKVRSRRGRVITSAVVRFASPRTPEESRELLAARPPAWEHLLWAGTMYQEMQRYEDLYRDFKLGYSPLTGASAGRGEVVALLRRKHQDVLNLTPLLGDMFSPEHQERAFGAPGEPGDPDGIIHYASRIVAVYAEFLTWAKDLRGTSVPEEYRKLRNATADLVKQPVAEIREFIDSAVISTDDLPRRLEAEEKPIDFTLRLTLTMGEPELAAHRSAIDDVKDCIDDD